eukprot:CAMPEP_0202866652 /NCGR_PEP_ID=MMETSP1391-20130828/8255_1 /ASSEMBLY_ACC=CAM_ASM_000867 /TAXON_ID=1034604 /ORGANISM="Chlamydomonas leiostraca, Strain SAG 11-49" /LENGTH=92 /DNA_ID=CAMNT_0049546621 /DNA_START=1987 /DNA_END=2265 /DNA_ORIENTATION=-
MTWVSLVLPVTAPLLGFKRLEELLFPSLRLSIFGALGTKTSELAESARLAARLTLGEDTLESLLVACADGAAMAHSIQMPAARSHTAASPSR